MERERKVQKANQSAPKHNAKFCSLVINFYYQLCKVHTTFKAGQGVTKFTSQEIVGVAFVGAFPVIFYLYDLSQ